MLSLILLALKGFTCFWALVTFAVAAAAQNKLNNAFGSGFVGSTDLAGVSVLIAAGVMTWLYLLADLVLLFVRPGTIMSAVIVDASIIGFLFILSLAGAATLSDVAGYFRYYSDFSAGQLGQAAIGLGWILTLLLLGLLLWELIWMFTRFGTSLPAWKTPFHNLLEDGAPSEGRRGRHTAGVSSAEAGQVPMKDVTPTPAPADTRTAVA